MCPDLAKASAYVEAGSQQFDNLGPNRLSSKRTVTALAIIAFIRSLSAIAKCLNPSVEFYRVF